MISEEQAARGGLPNTLFHTRGTKAKITEKALRESVLGVCARVEVFSSDQKRIFALFRTDVPSLRRVSQGVLGNCSRKVQGKRNPERAVDTEGEP
ncbi:MAG: hypothetical protein QXD59_05945 [Candidatus Caldarchaeum sp.]